jgi:hypothetical protein
LHDVRGIEAVDLAVGRLEPYPANFALHYPKIKDPTKEFHPGASLCKLGFPFHEIQPVWNEQEGKFEFAAGALPLPLFPIEGILTRFLQNPAWANAQPFPLRQIETSSPGFRGQSGGPIFDVHGAIWGIQSHTLHQPLGFNPTVKGKDGKDHVEHQFLNVGRGVHAETIIGLLNQLGVAFELSDH